MNYHISILSIACCVLITGKHLDAFNPTQDSSQQSQSDIEVSGLLYFNNTYSFSIHHPSSHASKWVDLGRVAFDYRLDSYDPKTGTLTVSANGVLKKLQIRDTDDTPVELNFLPSGNTDATEYIEMSTRDIAPELPGQQSLHALKSKVRYSVTARSDTKRPSPISLGGSHSTHTTADQTSLPLAPVTTRDTRNTTSGSSTTIHDLTESELIALSIYEKNHVVVREPPRDVEIVFPVSPR